ncbi:hypothetical protein FOA52_000369 [Chlamydomonas sp. UWO 241]|nr:hypothetical protein FOA52_000369 [Chlamydomonas sp. UWO 241]
MPLLKKRPHGASVVGAAAGRQRGARASGSQQHISLDCSSDSDEDDKENTPAVPKVVNVSRGASAPFKCPLPASHPNAPAPGARRGTLGARKSGMAGMMAGFARVLGPGESSAAPGSAVPLGAPLLVFDPDNDDDCPGRTDDRGTLSKVFVEPFIAAKLRPHQAEGVKFMLQCMLGLRNPKHTGVVLADGMGLGKTFQSCATIWTLLTTGLHSGKPTVKRPVILCPSSLVSNWGSELIKWQVLLGSRVEPVLCDDTRAAQVKDTLGRFGGFTKNRKPQVLVMSYTTFRLHKALVYSKGIDMVICDEAHQLKNAASQITLAVAGMPAKMRLLLTGTPIQNDLMEFFTLFHTSVPGLLGELSAFRKRYENPILRSQDADASAKDVAIGQERSVELLNLCGGFMLRRTSAINKQYLPACVETVVFCRMATLQQRLYSFFLASAPVRRALHGKASADGPDLQVGRSLA